VGHQRSSGPQLACPRKETSTQKRRPPTKTARVLWLGCPPPFSEPTTTCSLHRPEWIPPELQHQQTTPTSKTTSIFNCHCCDDSSSPRQQSNNKTWLPLQTGLSRLRIEQLETSLRWSQLQVQQHHHKTRQLQHPTSCTRKPLKTTINSRTTVHMQY
jgi:hypothetical protein